MIVGGRGQDIPRHHRCGMVDIAQSSVPLAANSLPQDASLTSQQLSLLANIQSHSLTAVESNVVPQDCILPSKVSAITLVELLGSTDLFERIVAGSAVACFKTVNKQCRAAVDRAGPLSLSVAASILNNFFAPNFPGYFWRPGQTNCSLPDLLDLVQLNKLGLFHRIVPKGRYCLLRAVSKRCKAVANHAGPSSTPLGFRYSIFSDIISQQRTAGDTLLRGDVLEKQLAFLKNKFSPTRLQRLRVTDCNTTDQGLELKRILCTLAHLPAFKHLDVRGTSAPAVYQFVFSRRSLRHLWPYALKLCASRGGAGLPKNTNASPQDTTQLKLARATARLVQDIERRVIPLPEQLDATQPSLFEFAAETFAQFEAGYLWSITEPLVFAPRNDLALRYIASLEQTFPVLRSSLPVPGPPAPGQLEPERWSWGVFKLKVLTAIVQHPPADVTALNRACQCFFPTNAQAAAAWPPAANQIPALTQILADVLELEALQLGYQRPTVEQAERTHAELFEALLSALKVSPDAICYTRLGRMSLLEMALRVGAWMCVKVLLRRGASTGCVPIKPEEAAQSALNRALLRLLECDACRRAMHPGLGLRRDRRDRFFLPDKQRFLKAAEMVIAATPADEAELQLTFELIKLIKKC